jgi:cell division protein FtsB
MFWTATMPAWVGIGLILAFALLAAYFAFVARRHALSGEYAAANRQRTIDALVTERDGGRATLEARDRELAALHEENTALQREVERLNTLEAEAVPPKRPPRGGSKKGAP